MILQVTLRQLWRCIRIRRKMILECKTMNDIMALTRLEDTLDISQDRLRLFAGSYRAALCIARS